jgi:hypothetical protein
MNQSWIRIRAVMRKEFREYRRNRFIIYTMGTLPLIFTALPVISLFSISSTTPPSVVRTQVAITLLLLLVIPVVLPATIAAYSVIGERDQGTLEPLLTTPISREEFLLGKSLAATIPTVSSRAALRAPVSGMVGVGGHGHIGPVLGRTSGPAARNPGEPSGTRIAPAHVAPGLQTNCDGRHRDRCGVGGNRRRGVAHRVEDVRP